MKELSTEEKARAYDEALEKAKQIIVDYDYDEHNNVFMEIFPQLKESEDERIRKEIIYHIRNCDDTIDEETEKKMIAWLEKQGSITKLSDEEQNKFAKCVLTSCALSFIDYLDAHKYEDKMCVSNGECEDIENAFHNAMWDRLHRYYCKYIEKQGEQNTIDKIQIGKKYKCIASPRYSTFVKGLIYKPEDEFLCSLMNFCPDCFEPIEDVEQKQTDKVEPKFKVKYAGSEYNVFETKDIAGVTFYGIEDEPNHIDYVKAENCEIINVYGIKENGSPYPTKPAVFSEQKSADKIESITQSYITPNSEFFQWIYDRLIYVHHENPNVDYMLSLKKRIEDMQNPINDDMKEALQTEYEKGRADTIAEIQKHAWSEKDEKEYKYVLKFVDNILNNCGNKKDYEHCKRCYD